MQDTPPTGEQPGIRGVVGQRVREPPTLVVMRRDESTRGELLEGVGSEWPVEQRLDGRWPERDADH